MNWLFVLGLASFLLGRKFLGLVDQKSTRFCWILEVVGSLIILFHYNVATTGFNYGYFMDLVVN